MFLRTVAETGYGAAFRGCTVFLFSGDSQRFCADFFHDLQDFFCIGDIDDADSSEMNIDREMLFVPMGPSDAVYCDFIMPGEKQPCNKIGANRQAKKKVAADPALKEYRSAYQRLNKRVELGYWEKEAFQAWATEAKSRCTQCQNGEITIEEYQKWLDETSRQRKTAE